MRYCGERDHAAPLSYAVWGPYRKFAAPGVFDFVMCEPNVGVCSLGNKRRIRSRNALQIHGNFPSFLLAAAAT